MSPVVTAEHPDAQGAWTAAGPEADLSHEVTMPVAGGPDASRRAARLGEHEARRALLALGGIHADAQLLAAAWRRVRDADAEGPDPH